MVNAREADSQGKPAFVFWCFPGETARGPRIAAAIGAETVYSYITEYKGRKLPTIARYVVQALHTWRRLRGIRPRCVFVQNPPVFAPLVVAIYGRLHRCPFVVDNHSSFLDARWQAFHWLQRPLGRRAAINLAHNEANLELLEGWGLSNALLLKSPAVSRADIYEPDADLGPYEKPLAHEGLKVFMVNRFAIDDAYHEVFEAARHMPEARFFLTGNPQKAGLNPSTAPANVVLTGFLKRGVFLKLMEACDVVLTLTLRKDTLLWSIRECLALGKPFVASDTRVMRLEFDGYGLFTDHTPTDLCAKIREAYHRRAEFTAKMAPYIEEDKERWRRDIERIQGILDKTPGP